MDQNQLKQQVAQAAIKHILEDGVIGVGSGSTVDFFIDELAKIKNKIEAVVPASIATEKRLRQHGIAVTDLNSVGELAIYIDGADEVNAYGQCIKGGGGALTREKILATAAKQFICIVDETKVVDVLGKKHPVPLEVIELSRSIVARAMVKMHAEPEFREGFVSDNGHPIIDVYDLDLTDPVAMEEKLNQMTGIISNGIFAKRPADHVLVATANGIKELL